jgi:hypothetical protein
MIKPILIRLSTFFILATALLALVTAAEAEHPPAEGRKRREPPEWEPSEEDGIEEGAVGRPAGLPTPGSFEAGYELSDLSASGTVKFGAWLVGIMVVTFIIVSLFQWLIIGRIGTFAPPQGEVDIPPPAPVPAVVQSRAASGEEYNMLRAAQDERLATYGWIDQQGGVVHIPIERAIQLTVERGLPTRPDDEAQQWRDQGLELPIRSSSGRMMEQVEQWLFAVPAR